MDRRQQRTRQAVLEAFAALLQRKRYEKITIQEIIDAANVGRSTFYAHFATKDELLRSICNELLAHLVHEADDSTHTHGVREAAAEPLSIFLHSLKHLQENDHSILHLMSSENRGLFLGYYRRAVAELVRTQFPVRTAAARRGVPEELLQQQLTSSYITMVEWWLERRKEVEPERLDKYFRALTEPLLE